MLTDRRSSSGGTLDRPGEAVCVRLLSSLLIKNIKASVPAPQTDARFRNRPSVPIKMKVMKKKIGVIGCGNMGSVLAEVIISAGLYKVYVSDIRKEKLKKPVKLGAQPACNIKLAENSDVIILAVKPDKAGETLEEIKNFLSPSKTIISIAAGISTAAIEKSIGEKIPVVRLMPNVNVRVKAGLLPYCTGKYAAGCGKLTEQIFSPMGIVFKLPEKKFDSVTALSGSGPGFLFYIAENINIICREKGFTDKQSRAIAAYLLYGAGKMLVETGLPPEKLKQMVTSPGGTTLAGLNIFKQKNFPRMLKNVIDSAEKRSRELSRRK